jgi:hypothetical protein
MAKSKETITNLEKDLFKQKARLDHEGKEHERLRKVLDQDKFELTRRLESAQQDISQKEKTIIGLNESYNKLEIKHKEELKNKETEILQLGEQKTQLEKEKEDLQKVISKNLEEIKAKDQQITSLQSEEEKQKATDFASFFEYPTLITKIKIEERKVDYEQGEESK